MLRGIVVRLYIDDDNTMNSVNSLLGTCRFVYNQALDYKIKQYRENKKSTSLTDTSHFFHNVLRKDDEYYWLKEHNTKVLKQSLRDLEQAYTNFFKHNKGFPKFKSKSKNEDKCRFPSEAISKDTFNNGKLNLTKKIKDIRFECSDRDRKTLLKNKEFIRSITITKTKTNKHYASILIEASLPKSHPVTDRVVGIDVGVKELMVLSDGTTIKNIKSIRSAEKELQKLQRSLSRKVKGSKNRAKARHRLAVKHEKIKNKKNDYIHKITDRIINENQVIIIEDLNISGMMKNKKLAKSIPGA